MAEIGSFRVTPAKVQQIMEAGRKQLSPEEFEELESLLLDLEIYGFTPWINTQLGRLMAKIQWELEVGPSPEWEEALIACDRAFLGRELKDMCLDAGLSTEGHKKELCAKLFRSNVPEVVAVMEPYLTEETPERLPQILHLYLMTEAGLELTPRRLEILRLIARGYSNESIAAELDISEQVVKNHVSSIMWVLGAGNRGHAVLIAKERGLI